jgi:hypothetical protein
MAHADFAEDARNHGYNSGAYELVCGAELTLTDAKGALGRAIAREITRSTKV